MRGRRSEKRAPPGRTRAERAGQRPGEWSRCTIPGRRRPPARSPGESGRPLSAHYRHTQIGWVILGVVAGSRPPGDSPAARGRDRGSRGPAPRGPGARGPAVLDPDRRGRRRGHPSAVRNRSRPKAHPARRGPGVAGGAESLVLRLGDPPGTAAASSGTSRATTRWSWCWPTGDASASGRTSRRRWSPRSRGPGVRPGRRPPRPPTRGPWRLGAAAAWVPLLLVGLGLLAVVGADLLAPAAAAEPSP